MCQPAEWLVRAVAVTGMLVMVRDAAVGKDQETGTWPWDF
jgi:hypothetical protein